MILADTNIFIDFWNNPNESITKLFTEEDIVICGVVRAELLHGAVSTRDFINISTCLEVFDELNMKEEDWKMLGNHLYKLRKGGITVPFSDAIIATIALKHDIPICTGDKHFNLMKSILTDLRILSVDEQTKL